MAPYLVLGGTDARHYARLTRNALRFTPILMSKEDVGSVHGVNEKLSIDECSRMVGFYIAYIEELSNLSGELDIEPEPELETVEEDLIEVNPVEEPYAEMGKEELDALDKPVEEDQE